MSTKEYAGMDLQEIRRFFMEDNEIRYTTVVEERPDGFTLSAPNGEWGEVEGVDIYVVVWPRAEGGYWCEEY